MAGMGQGLIKVDGAIVSFNGYGCDNEKRWERERIKSIIFYESIKYCNYCIAYYI
jgi:hypothetical protein